MNEESILRLENQGFCALDRHDCPTIRFWSPKDGRCAVLNSETGAEVISEAGFCRDGKNAAGMALSLATTSTAILTKKDSEHLGLPVDYVEPAKPWGRTMKFW